MNKLLIIWSLTLILLISFVSAVPSGGVSYYNLSSTTDLWGSNDGTNYGMTNSTSFPSFNTSGNSSPSSGIFDNDYVDTGISFTSAQDFTFSAWVKFPSTTKVAGFVYNRGGSAFGLYHNGDGEARFQVGSGALVSGVNIDDDAWHHVVGTYDHSETESFLYVDGVQKATSTSYTVGSATSNILIGKDSYSTFYFEGLIDEVQIFDIPLSSTNVLDIYNYGSLDDVPDAPFPVSITNVELSPSTLYAHNDISAVVTVNTTTDTKIRYYWLVDDVNITSGTVTSYSGLNFTIPSLDEDNFTLDETVKLVTYALSVANSSVISDNDTSTKSVSTLPIIQGNISINPATIYNDSVVNGSVDLGYYTGVDVYYRWFVDSSNVSNGSVTTETSGTYLVPVLLNTTFDVDNNITLEITPRSESGELLGVVTNSSSVTVDSNTSSNSPSNSDVIAYWKLENLTDEKGSYDLTNYGVATSGATGIIDDAYSFDGSADYMDTGINFSSPTDFSISTWIKKTSATKIEGIVYSRGTSTYGIYHDASGDARFQHDGGALLSGVDIGGNVWNHIVATYDHSETTAKLYVNGVLKANSTSATINTPDTSLLIGKDSFSTRFFTGTIDETFITTEVLSLDTVEFLYANKAPGEDQQYEFSESIIYPVSITNVDLNPSTLYDYLNISAVVTVNTTTDTKIRYYWLVDDVNITSGTVTSYSGLNFTIPELGYTNYSEGDEVKLVTYALSVANDSVISNNDTSSVVVSATPSSVTPSFLIYPKGGLRTSSSSYFSFKANRSVNYTLDYGLTTSYGTELTGLDSDFVDINITGLNADSTYYYNLTITTSRVNNLSYQGSFDTMPSSLRDFKFGFFADLHVPSTNETRLSESYDNLLSENMDFLVFGGDVHYDNSVEDVSLIFSDNDFTVPLLGVAGNHDSSNTYSTTYADAKELWVNPKGGQGSLSGNNDFGDELVWAINYSYGCIVGVNQYLDLENSSIQEEYINQKLSECGSDQWFRAIIKHYPYEIDDDFQVVYDLMNVYNATSFSGHSHSTHYNLTQGLGDYVISTVSANPYTVGAYPGSEWADWNNTYHYGLISVNASHAVIDMYNGSDEIIKSVTVVNPIYVPPTGFTVSITNVELSPSTLYTNTDISAVVTVNTTTDTKIRYYWLVDDVNITSGTVTSYSGLNFTIPSLDNSNYVQTENVTLVTYALSVANNSVISDNDTSSKVVSNRNPTLTAISNSPTVPTNLDDLLFYCQFNDADGDTFDIDWSVYLNDVDTYNGTINTVSSDTNQLITTIDSSNLTIDDELYIECTATDSFSGSSGLQTGSTLTVIELNNLTITLTDVWSGDTINNFWVYLNDINYTTTTGIIITNVIINGTYESWVMGADNYFEEIQSFINITANYEGELTQSLVNFTSYELGTANLITGDINYTIDGITEDKLNYWELSEGNYTVLVEADGYFPLNYSFNVTALDIKTVSVPGLSSSVITITSNDVIGGSSISDFSGYIYDPITETNTSFSTDNGTVLVDGLNGTAYVVVVSPDNFASETTNFTVNSSYFNITTDHYASNSIRINIYNDTSYNLLNQNVSISILWDDDSMLNFTINGTKLFSFLAPEDYELRFSTPGFINTSFFITVTNDSTQEINVHLASSAGKDLQRFIVVDEVSDPVSGSIVRLQKEVVGYDGLWLTVDEKSTSSDGYVGFYVEKSTSTFYRMIVIYEGSVKLISDSTLFLPGVDEVVTLQISTLDEDEQNLYDSVVKTFVWSGDNNETLTFSWVDPSNFISGVKIEVWVEDFNLTGVPPTYSSFLSNSSSLTTGSLNITLPVVNDTRFIVNAYIVYNTYDELVYNNERVFGRSVIPDKNLGLILSFVVFLFVAFITISLKPLFSSILSFSVLGILAAFKLIVLPVTIITSFIALAIIFFIKIRRGGE